METPNEGIGAATDVDSVEPANGSVIALLKRMRFLLNPLTIIPLASAIFKVSHAGDNVAFPIKNSITPGQTFIFTIGFNGVYTNQASAVVIAPAANAVIADAGPVVVSGGNPFPWDIDIMMTAFDAVALNKGLIVEHRNGTNVATVRVLGGCPTSSALQISLRGYSMLNNERIRVICGAAGGAAASQFIASINMRPSVP